MNEQKKKKRLPVERAGIWKRISRKKPKRITRGEREKIAKRKSERKKERHKKKEGRSSQELGK